MPRPQPNPDGSVQTLPKPRPSANPDPVEGPEPVEGLAGERRPYNPADEVPGAKYRTIGSLIGRLGQIEVGARRQFRLYDRHTGWATPVTHAPEHLGALTDALGETVIASGELWSNEHDQALRLEVTELEVIDTERLPSVADVSGIAPNFTGGLSSEEYVRRLRDDD